MYSYEREAIGTAGMARYKCVLAEDSSVKNRWHEPPFRCKMIMYEFC